MSQQNKSSHKPLFLALIWTIRTIGALAVIAAMLLLFVDSPLSDGFALRVSHRVVEAVPLLLIGFAYLAWLIIDRPGVIDLVKQLLLALAFILWGVSLLMPPSNGSRFVAAVVIAIYVFDLAWLMEGNLRKKFGLRPSNAGTECNCPRCQSTGVCVCCCAGGGAAREEYWGAETRNQKPE
jgi:hypothetical protein